MFQVQRLLQKNYCSNVYNTNQYFITGADIVGEVPTAFNLPGEDFKDKYGFLKPETSEYIVVHCKAGVRAQTAAKSMFGSGYSNVE